MLTDLPMAHGRLTRGTWQRVLTHTPEPEFKPYWTAIVCCPDCGKLLTCCLHTIAPDGQISPSLGHPTSYPPCGWHTNPKLLDWAPLPPTPPTPEISTCAKCGKQAHTIGGWGTWGNPGIICSTCFKEIYG